MSDIKTKKRKTWKNPLAVWGAKGGNHEVPTPEWKNPHQIWRDTKAFKVPTTKIGRFHYEYKSSNHGEKIWNRLCIFASSGVDKKRCTRYSFLYY